MISIDGNSLTGTNPHGSLTAEPWDAARVIQPYFGLTGETVLTGGLRGRPLSAWLLLTGFSTHELLHDQIELVNSYILTSGILLWTVGADSRPFANSEFYGLTLDEDPWEDGAGVNGWNVLGRLHFRQIKT